MRKWHQQSLKTRQLPLEQVAELVDHLTLSLHHAVDPSVESAWKTEVTQRVKVIPVTGIQNSVQPNA